MTIALQGNRKILVIIGKDRQLWRAYGGLFLWSHVMVEQWKEVVDYERVYEVSDQGRVRRHANTVTYRGTWPGRVLRNHDNGFGYYQSILIKDGKAKSYYVHRLVIASFLGRCPSGWEVNHIDGDKSNNHLGNLEYVTPKGNVCHARDAGLLAPAIGEKNGSSKLIESDVRQILVDLSLGLNQYDIAERVGVSQKSISNIKLNRTWKHLARPTQENIKNVQ